MFELTVQFLIHAGLLRNGIHLECDASTLLFSWSMPEASYFIGATNTSECPGSTQIQDEGAFKTAAASLGIVWNMSGAWFSSPRGCLKDVESTFQPTALGWNPQLESTFQPRALGWNPHSNPGVPHQACQWISKSAPLPNLQGLVMAYTSNLPMKGIELRVHKAR